MTRCSAPSTPIAPAIRSGSDRKSTRLNSSHSQISYAVFCLKKKMTNNDVPGVIGRVGTLLGEAGVDIAEYHQARLDQGGQSLASVSSDRDAIEATRASLLLL